MCNQVSEVSKKGKDIIILTDDNINTLEDKSASQLYKNYDLKQIRDNMIIDNRLTTHNDRPTFFRPGMTSCIDHIMTNCPDKITNVTTHYDNYKDYDSNNDYYDYEDCDYEMTKTKRTNLTISDHAIISCDYNSKFLKIPQLFRIIRDNNKLIGAKLR